MRIRTLFAVVALIASSVSACADAAPIPAPLPPCACGGGGGPLANPIGGIIPNPSPDKPKVVAPEAASIELR